MSYSKTHENSSPSICFLHFVKFNCSIFWPQNVFTLWLEMPLLYSFSLHVVNQRKFTITASEIQCNFKKHLLNKHAYFNLSKVYSPMMIIICLKILVWYIIARELNINQTISWLSQDKKEQLPLEHFSKKDMLCHWEIVKFHKLL